MTGAVYCNSFEPPRCAGKSRAAEPARYPGGKSRTFELARYLAGKNHAFCRGAPARGAAHALGALAESAAGCAPRATFSLI